MPAPWNLYPARNVNTNGHIEVEYFNLLKPDSTVPLGICNSSMRFYKSSTNLVLVELLYVFLANDTWWSQRKTQHKSNGDLSR